MADAGHEDAFGPDRTFETFLRASQLFRAVDHLAFEAVRGVGEPDVHLPHSEQMPHSHRHLNNVDRFADEVICSEGMSVPAALQPVVARHDQHRLPSQTAA